MLLACRSAAPKIHNEIVPTHLELLSKLSDFSSSPRTLPESPSTAHFDLATPPVSPNFAAEVEADGATAMSPGGRMAFDQAMMTGVVPTGIRGPQRQDECRVSQRWQGRESGCQLVAVSHATLF